MKTVLQPRGQMRIMRTSLCNVDPLAPHFYIVKQGFAGVYINFLLLLKNLDCRYSLEPEAVLYPRSMF